MPLASWPCDRPALLWEQELTEEPSAVCRFVPTVTGGFTATFYRCVVHSSSRTPILTCTVLSRTRSAAVRGLSVGVPSIGALFLTLFLITPNQFSRCRVYERDHGAGGDRGCQCMHAYGQRRVLGQQQCMRTSFWYMHVRLIGAEYKRHLI